jgi:hypothetical protein
MRSSRIPMYCLDFNVWEKSLSLRKNRKSLRG